MVDPGGTRSVSVMWMNFMVVCCFVDGEMRSIAIESPALQMNLMLSVRADVPDANAIPTF